MKAIFIVFLLIFFHSFSPPGKQQAAFKHFFKGNIAFQNKNFKKASDQFKQAHLLLPGNFDIALSYAVSLSMSKNTKRGLAVIQKIKISDSDPNRLHKKTLKFYATGVIHAFHHDFGQAILSFRKALKLTSKETPLLLANIHNALGYVTIMNQGTNVDKGADMGRHLHVLRSDMTKAFSYFKKAVTINPQNENAQYNYRTLRDTLERYHFSKPDTSDRIKKYTPFVELSQNVFDEIPLGHYNEVVLMLDISGSMVQEKVTCKAIYRFEVMREAVLFLLKNLPESVAIGIGTIGGNCGTPPRLWIRAGSQTRKELIQEIEFLVPDGTTPLISILKRAPELFSANNHSKKAIFLISDGENVCKDKGTDLCEWAGNLSNTTIQTLTFLDAQLNNANAFSAYSCLAENTGGEINYIDNNYCQLKKFSFNLLDAFAPRIPQLKRVQCWGARYKLWAIFDGF